MKFRDELDRWEAREKLNQAEAAARLGVNLRTYQGWKLGQGKRAPKPFIQQMIRRTLLRN